MTDWRPVFVQPSLSGFSSASHTETAWKGLPVLLLSALALSRPSLFFFSRWKRDIDPQKNAPHQGTMDDVHDDVVRFQKSAVAAVKALRV
jgi:hypothetical protein